MTALADNEAASFPSHGPERRSIPKKLETLTQEIKSAYDNELTAIARRMGIDDTISNVRAESLRSKTIRELLDPQPDNPLLVTTPKPVLSSIKLHVIQSWNDLLDALIQHNVFLDYCHSMEEAFREIEETPPPEETTPEATMAASVVWFRHQWNLVRLLTHTVVNHFRDNCTECRFVTLLEV
ncbi:hypothetical protein (Partial), partial [Seminavis robusta]|eukprot:Sro846_g210090.1 n/a (181) ;mRNA; r:2-544